MVSPSGAPWPFPVTAGIILDGEGRILLAQRPQGDALSLKWEFPGGKIRYEETPEACLERELLEELGIRVRVLDIFHAVIHRYPDRAILLLAYWCHWNGGEIRLRFHRAHRWVEPMELLEMPLAEADLPIARKLKERLEKGAPAVFPGPS
jgi:8-oxo-dGTP diphosphatase